MTVIIKNIEIPIEPIVHGHLTNADRIRAMTDEELAEWINKHDFKTLLHGYDPKDAILDWLKQEVKNDKVI